MIEKVVGGGEPLALFEVQGSDPGRVARVKTVGQSQELTHLASLGHRLQGNG
jgi:hypothetical protein